MASGRIKIDVGVTKYRFIFFPVATYTRAGDVAILTIFGVPVFQRCGDLVSVLGIVRGQNAS